MKKQHAETYQKARQAIKSGQAIDSSLLHGLEAIADAVPDTYWPEYLETLEKVREMVR